MRLALGTAQFGADYGIAGGRQVPADEIAAILARASAAGIDTLDTAAAYGDSEAAIGAQARRREFRVISKWLPGEGLAAHTDIARSVTASLQRLAIDRLHGLLVHRGSDLLGADGDAIWRALQAERAAGRVERIGASVYRPEEAEAVLARYQPDIVQAPLNVLDQRLLTSGVLPRLHAAGVEVHVRSVFLQGLLLQPLAQLPAWTDRWREQLRRCRQWSDAADLTPVAACLQFALAQPGVARVVVGVDHAAQLAEVIGHACANVALPPADSLACSDEALIHPSRWPA